MYKRNLGFLIYLFSSSLCLLILIAPTNAEANSQSMVQILQRLEILEKKSRELTGQNEVLKHQLEQLKKVQKQGFLGIDQQIEQLRQRKTQKVTARQTTKPVAAVKPRTPVAKPANTVTRQASKPAPSKAAPAKASTGKNRAPTTYEKETYQAAFNKMSASPTAATRAFKDYIKLQPNSPLAANAQYWIGEIMYSHNNYKGAIQEFIKVLQQHKTSNKAPDAAIKLGYSFYALKNWTYARRTFEDVLRYFPDNKNAVSLATKRLEKMKLAGN